MKNYIISDNWYFLTGVSNIEGTGSHHEIIHTSQIASLILDERINGCIVYINAIESQHDAVELIVSKFNVVLWVISLPVIKSSKEGGGGDYQAKFHILNKYTKKGVNSLSKIINEDDKCIFTKLFRGKGIKEISNLMKLDEKTIYNKRRVLLKKFGLENMNPARGTLIVKKVFEINGVR